MDKPILYIVIPCYNEEAVLPVTNTLFLGKVNELIAAGEIAEESRILFVDDGSRDKTWDIIAQLHGQDVHFEGLKLSRNRGHQNALLAGLMTAKTYADITISIDCDGQDDIDAMNGMLHEYKDGADIVYGVRANGIPIHFSSVLQRKAFIKSFPCSVRRSCLITPITAL